MEPLFAAGGIGDRGEHQRATYQDSKENRKKGADVAN